MPNPTSTPAPGPRRPPIWLGCHPCKPRTLNSAVYDGTLLGFWPPLGSSSVSLSRFVSKYLPCQQHPRSFSFCQAHRQDMDLKGLDKALHPLYAPWRLGERNKLLLYEAPRTGGQRLPLSPERGSSSNSRYFHRNLCLPGLIHSFTHSFNENL
mgnify:CR=1 FL=1